MNRGRVVRATLAMGAIAVVVAAAPYRAFDLDRFFVPKELALHATALAVAIACVWHARQFALTRVDLLLAVYLGWSLLSALLATNHWLGARAVAITFSSAALFWAARATAAGGSGRPIVTAGALAAVIGAGTALAQAYGVSSDLFSLNRAPGGTFGNRNFMAHLAAIGAPALVFTVITTRRTWGAALGAVGMAAIAAALVLSRTRAAWLGLAAGAALLVIGLWRAHERWSDARSAGRMRILALAAAVGVLTAVALPNTLEWRSDSPYLDTVTGVVNFREGSGRGRVVQYTATLRMAAAHPLLGVGTGNWAVAYPRFAAPNDPSLDLDDGMTSNPWPSSDWVAIAAERGVPALVAISLVLLGLAMGAWRRADRASGAAEYLEGLALATTLVVTAIVGAFDAVLLLPAPALVAWSLFGALAAPSPVRRALPLSVRGARRARLAVGIVGGAIVFRSVAQVAAMAVYGDAATLPQVEAAEQLDPGSYRIQLRLALLEQEHGNCDGVRNAAGAARALFPNAAEPRRLLRACDPRDRTRR